jgi:hypothetical protein
MLSKNQAKIACLNTIRYPHFQGCESTENDCITIMISDFRAWNTELDIFHIL